MTRHWQPPGAGSEASAGAIPQLNGRFDIAFVRHGPRTGIARQFVSYPFHFTRPFRLDTAIPELLTLYQQSSSGGLYRAEQLGCDYTLAAGAAAHVTTQAATVVHDCHGKPARQDVTIRLGAGAYFALAPDPLVMFPGAISHNTVSARLATGAVLFLCDAFAMHDPRGEGRVFEELTADTRICDEQDRLLVRDTYRLSGSALAGPASPMGAWKVMASFLLVGPPERLPTRADLDAVSQGDAAVLGISPLPGEAGWTVRCLAADAVAARRIGEHLFTLSGQAAFGRAPVPRRK